MSTSSSQPNFAGIQTLITPTSQYVFPPSILPPDQSPTTTQPPVNQDGQIQKYPPFVGQAVTTSTNVQLANRLGILNSSAVTTTTAGTKRVLTVSKPSPSVGKTPKTKPSKSSTPVANSKSSVTAKSTKKIKLDPSYFTPPTVKATPRKKASSVSSSATKISTPGSAAKAVRKTPRMKAGAAVSNMGRWHPSDDLALISAVQQTNDLAAVYRGVQFSCKFTQKEIEERWHALLLDRHLSKLAMTAVKALPASVTTIVLKQSLWSEAEEQVLAGIPSTEDVNVEKFSSLLGTRGSVFHYTRTPQCLYRHWLLMKQYDLLDDQEVPPIGPADDVTEFSDVEDQLLLLSQNSKPRDSKEEALEQELTLADQVAKKEIIRLEQNILEWQRVLTVPSHIAFDDGVFAVWKGKRVQYEMKSLQVTIGRNSSNSQVDFDLLLEGMTHRVSRKQAVMSIKDSGSFVLYNCGRRPIYVDGQPLLTDKSAVLSHNQLIEVCSLSFLVLLNQELVDTTLQSRTL